ncbi:DUF1566 domain-containing protein [Leptospira kmetyi]|uniref:Lcl C-terminal domain-containing protein n=1 Tax=Leptospira kmetyi TaxID=408139 RepID=UPI000289CBA5|nr:DUF1566 domain-containing protein [Leptospira kmetyi]EQA55598.1 PF07603 family protein [Leptospira kmetyi serovar Malaysia str. Bejo-Iso9]TGL69435.1 DUF1566 domain-containing protein [Leptospira kmetyi]
MISIRTFNQRKNFHSFIFYNFLMLFLVLAVPAISAAPFVDNGDGTVTDIGNSLIWQKCTNNLSGADCTLGGTTQLNWSDALTYCNGLNLAGRVWRLPNITELRTIVDHSFGVSPVIDSTTFPATATQYYWSSTTYVLATSQAWSINFQSGFTAGTNGKNYVLFVRCVTSPP